VPLCSDAAWSSEGPWWDGSHGLWDVAAVNPRRSHSLLKNGYSPMISSVAATPLRVMQTTSMPNTVAGDSAAALEAEKLICSPDTSWNPALSQTYPGSLLAVSQPCRSP